MKLLLTSAGISNASLREELTRLLGQPVEESSALFIPTAIYPFPGGGQMAWRALTGDSAALLAQLGWKSLGLLELTALPSIDEECWVPAVQEADALLVWGGDPLYLSHWLRESGLARLLPTLESGPVYVGVSAGSIAAAATFAETYHGPPSGAGHVLSTEDIVFTSPDGDIHRTLVTAEGAGLAGFGVIPHLEHPDHPDASWANAERWAAQMPGPVYAIDDQSAVTVTDGQIDVVSEGQWKLFSP